jgi:hypothetical protein
MRQAGRSIFRRYWPASLTVRLQDPELFGRVRLDPEVHTLVWPNGAHFDPATLHDWRTVVGELAARARASLWNPPLAGSPVPSEHGRQARARPLIEEAS